MYALYDNKVKSYRTPLAFASENEAMMEMEYFLRLNSQTIIAVDHELFFLGTYDTMTGKYDLLPKPEHKLNCALLIKDPTEQETRQFAEDRIRMHMINDLRIKKITIEDLTEIEFASLTPDELTSISEIKEEAKV